mmetsp:Transcript_24409/g.37058  ORF Transcript_24409/g.37058 Transcript_24409/m.37058 type:complete len:491 (-) Transcript_24409:120-1592(-)
MSSDTNTTSHTGRDEELAIMSLLQIRKAPPTTPASSKDQSREPAAKRQKVQCRDEAAGASGTTRKSLEQQQLASDALRSEEERYMTLREVVLSHKKLEEDTPAPAPAPHTSINGQFDDPAVPTPDEVQSDVRRIERELALRSMEQSPLEQELALRALQNASLANVDPYHRLAAASVPSGAQGAALAMSHRLFPSPSLLASSYLQQQRARQIQLENVMLRAQLAAVEQQRIKRLALLNPTGTAPNRASFGEASAPAPGTTTACNESWASRQNEKAIIPGMPSNIPTTLVNVKPTASSSERPPTPDISKDKMKPAMKPTGLAKKPENQRLCTRTKFRYEHYTPPPSWGELTDVPKIPAVPADDDMKNPVEVAGENDVLLGRGGATNMHPGNINFRNLVQKYRSAYCTVPKGDKGALARFLCNYVRAKKGRFLRQESSDKKWYEVGDEKAICKCGQALREGSAEYLKQKNSGGQPKCGMPMRMFAMGETTQSR